MSPLFFAFVSSFRGSFVEVVEELESADVITIVGHFFPNDILIGYTTTTVNKKKQQFISGLNHSSS